MLRSIVHFAVYSVLQPQPHSSCQKTMGTSSRRSPRCASGRSLGISGGPLMSLASHKEQAAGGSLGRVDEGGSDEHSLGGVKGKYTRVGEARYKQSHLLTQPRFSLPIESPVSSTYHFIDVHPPLATCRSGERPGTTIQ